MTEKDYTTRRRSFQHLTKEKRAPIEVLLRQGEKKTKIAKVVGISRSTLYEELARGTEGQRIAHDSQILLGCGAASL